MVNRIGYTALLISLIFVSCHHHKNRWHDIDLSNIPDTEISIKRYEKAIFDVDPDHLKNEIANLTQSFPVFLDVSLDDTLNLIKLYNYITDPLLIELYSACIEQFPDLEFLKKELGDAITHYKYYYPERTTPEIYTYVSGLDFEYPVGFADSIMIIALDMYLGADYGPYKEIGIPLYLVKRFDKKYMVSDCMKEIALYELQGVIPGETMIDRMIHEGKVLFFIDAMIPLTPDESKIGYLHEQLAWCQSNESDLWKFIIENDLLYTTDLQIINKFFNDGPFTRGFDGSPSRLGIWLGWQIVRAYMNNNPDVTLQQLLADTNTKNILARSKYKPKR